MMSLSISMGICCALLKELKSEGIIKSTASLTVAQRGGKEQSDHKTIGYGIQ